MALYIGSEKINLNSGVGGIESGGTTFEDALSMFAENEYPTDSLVLSCESIKSWIFHSIPVSKVYLPNAKTIKNNAFGESDYLTTVRLGCVKSLGYGVFMGSYILDKVIIETTNDSDLSELLGCITSSSYVFSGTLIENYSGYIYVPESVIDKYHIANENWEFGFDNSMIVTIEDNLDLLAEDFPDLVEKYGNGN